MESKKSIGSSFDAFLEQEDILESVNIIAVKAVLGRTLKEYMKKNAITLAKMAEQLETSRTGLQRLLDPDICSVNLLVLDRAASVLGKKVTMHLENASTPKK